MSPKARVQMVQLLMLLRHSPQFRLLPLRWPSPPKHLVYCEVRLLQSALPQADYCDCLAAPNIAVAVALSLSRSMSLSSKRARNFRGNYTTTLNAKQEATHKSPFFICRRTQTQTRDTMRFFFLFSDCCD
jgi:hypothetical protein